MSDAESVGGYRVTFAVLATGLIVFALLQSMVLPMLSVLQEDPPSCGRAPSRPSPATRWPSFSSPAARCSLPPSRCSSRTSAHRTDPHTLEQLERAHPVLAPIPAATIVGDESE